MTDQANSESRIDLGNIKGFEGNLEPVQFATLTSLIYVSGAALDATSYQVIFDIHNRPTKINVVIYGVLSSFDIPKEEKKKTEISIGFIPKGRNNLEIIYDLKTQHLEVENITISYQKIVKDKNNKPTKIEFVYENTAYTYENNALTFKLN
jgi:hypothetical protein